MYFSGQGKLKIAPIVNGVRGAYRWVGNVPEFKPAFDTTKFEHKESWSGQRLLDKTIIQENKASLSVTLEDWSQENVAMATRALVTVVPGDTVVDEASPAALAVGDEWALAHPKVTSVTITDSAGSPVTVNPAHYTVDLVFGVVTIVNLAAYTLPLQASYDYAAVDSLAFFTDGAGEVAVRFEGVNTADNNKPILVEYYRIQLDPTKELGLITEELGQFVLDGTALIDSTKEDDPIYGKFGRFVDLS